MQRPVRLWLVKQLANMVTPWIIDLVPEVSADSVVGKLIEGMFDRVIQLHRFQRQQMPQLDENFLNFLKALKRILIYIAEADDVYYHWLGLATRIFAEELEQMDLGDCGRVLYVSEGFLQTWRENCRR